MVLQMLREVIEVFLCAKIETSNYWDLSILLIDSKR